MKRKAKRVLSALLAVVMVLSMVTVGVSAAEVVDSGTCGTNLTWVLTDDGELTISGSGKMTNYSLGNYAPWYSHKDSITSVVIDSGVTIIGEYAFYNCSSLTSVAIPDSVIRMDSSAFSQCKSLSHVEISNINAWLDIAFTNETSNPLSYAQHLYVDGNLVTEVEIPSSISEAFISSYAFVNCVDLVSVHISEGITTIGPGAFKGCSNLKNINIPEGVTTIACWAFAGCSNLESIIIPDSVTKLGVNIGAYNNLEGHTFQNCTSLRSINIPDSVTSIGRDMFYGCSSLTSIAIPDSVTIISQYAFYNCSSLTSINIPDGVTSIGDGAFEDCSSLTEVYVSDIESWCEITFYSGTSNPLNNEGALYLNGELATDLAIPDSVTSIGEYTFYGCSSLSSIEFPDSMTSIEDYAFYKCSSLTSISIPASVTSIGNGAFKGCSRLTSINIPDGVPSIGRYVFCNCGRLTSVAIPDSVTSIGEGAFEDCSSLNNINIPDSVTSIGEYAFHNCSNLTSINIPAGVTSIGDEAFSYCSSLTSVNIPASVTNIGNYVFCGCSSLISVNIPASVTSIGEYAFYNCSRLTSIELPASVTSIGSMAFCGCSRLTSIVLPASVTSIGDSVFRYCSSLTDVYYSGSKSDWSAISIGTNNECLTNATIHFNSTGPDDINDGTTVYVRYFSSWDAENQIAYLDNDIFGSQVTADTDTSFLENVDSLVGQYVLAKTKARDDETVGSDTLISIKAVETKTGTVSSADADANTLTIDGATYSINVSKIVHSSDGGSSIDLIQPDFYVGEFVLYHICDGGIVGIETLSKAEGILTSWNSQTQELTLGPSVGSLETYRLSPLADADTVDYLSHLGYSFENQDICYIADQHKFVYQLFKLPDSIVTKNKKPDVWGFSNSSSAFGDEGYYITTDDYNRLIGQLDTVQADLVSLTGNKRLATIKDVQEGAVSKYLWQTRYNTGESSSYYQEWSGSCYGMSTWVCLNAAGVLHASDIDATVSLLSQYSLNKSESTDAESAINYYHQQQHLTAVQEKIEEFMLKPQIAQISYLEQLATSASNGGNLVSIDFQWYTSFNSDGSCDRESGFGHRVVGYGIESGDYTEFVSKNMDGRVSDIEFTHKILIYDCAAPNGGDYYDLYYNDNGTWCIPGWKIISTSSQSSDTKYNNGQLKIVTANVDLINTIDFNTGEPSSLVKETLTAQRYYMIQHANAHCTIESDSFSAEISGFSVLGNTSDEQINVCLDANITLDGESEPTFATVFLPQASNYIVTTDKDDLFFQLYSGNYLTTVLANVSGSVAFETDGTVALNADLPGDYYIRLTADEGYYNLPWCTIEIGGSDAARISAELTEYGVLVSGDNLTDVTVCGSNNEQTVEIIFSTEDDHVLISEKDNRLTALTDTDGDGVYETDIAEDPIPPTAQFTDVKSTDWFYPYVTEAARLGLMSGTGNNQFSPYGTTTRAMFVQILYAMAGKPEGTIDNPFTDVPENAWYAKAVQWAYENGVTGGTGDTTFSPNANVTREQIAVFLYAYAGKPEVSGSLSSFADASKVSGWAKNAVIWATQNKVISGSSEGGKLYLNPKKNATRAETATMMVGFVNLL